MFLLILLSTAATENPNEDDWVAVNAVSVNETAPRQLFEAIRKAMSEDSLVLEDQSNSTIIKFEKGSPLFWDKLTEMFMKAIRPGDTSEYEIVKNFLIRNNQKDAYITHLKQYNKSDYNPKVIDTILRRFSKKEWIKQYINTKTNNICRKIGGGPIK